MEMIDLEVKLFEAHFPTNYENQIEDFITNDLMISSRYIFVERIEKEYYGRCSHCDNVHLIEKPKQKSHIECFSCGSKCEVRYTRYKNAGLIDRGYFEYFFKSVIDPNVIVAIGAIAWRDYSHGLFNVKNTYDIRARYIFDCKTGPQMIEYRWYKNNPQRNKNVFSLQSRYNGFCAFGFSKESIELAIKGTKFQYCEWDQYNHYDITKFFALFSKYPIIEYFTKLGFKEIVEGKLYGRQTLRVVNWKGKDMFKMLRITKQEFKEIKKSKIMIDTRFLQLLQVAKKSGSKLDLVEIKEASSGAAYNQDKLIELMKYSSLTKIINYAKKQREKRPEYISLAVVIGEYKDYITDCIKLKMDLENDVVLMPRNLFEAHENTISRVKYEANKQYEASFRKRAAALKKYSLEHNGLLIRPVKSPQELIREGELLKHCVGGYAMAYAAGTTAILVIRKVDEPDIPYYTVEVRKGVVIQVQGFRHCLPDKDVKKLMNQFEKVKLKPKKQSKQVSAEGGIACQI